MASTCAMCRASMSRSSSPSVRMRDNAPLMFMRQGKSAPTSTSAPVAMTVRHFSLTISPEISGCLTEKVPPKPQQRSLCSSAR